MIQHAHRSGVYSAFYIGIYPVAYYGGFAGLTAGALHREQRHKRLQLPTTSGRLRVALNIISHMLPQSGTLPNSVGQT